MVQRCSGPASISSLATGEVLAKIQLSYFQEIRERIEDIVWLKLGKQVS